MFSILAFLAVTIMVEEPPRPIGCSPKSLVVKQSDGSYQRYTPDTVHLVHLNMCWTEGGKHYEVWTDYPEKGGKFIRVIEPAQPNDLLDRGVTPE